MLCDMSSPGVACVQMQLSEMLLGFAGLFVCLFAQTPLLIQAKHTPHSHLSPCSLQLNVHILKYFIFEALSTDPLGFLLATHEHGNETIFVQQFSVSIPPMI